MSGGGEAPSKGSSGCAGARPFWKVPPFKSASWQTARSHPRSRAEGRPPRGLRGKNLLSSSPGRKCHLYLPIRPPARPWWLGAPPLSPWGDAAGGFCLALLARKRASRFVSSHLAPSTGSRARTHDTERPPALPSGSAPPAPRPHATAQLR